MNFVKGLGSVLSKTEVSHQLQKASQEFCAPDQKIAFVNRWIREGKSIPNKWDYEKPEDVDVARMVRTQYWSKLHGNSPMKALSHQAFLAVEKESTSKIAVDLGGGTSALLYFSLIINGK